MEQSVIESRLKHFPAPLFAVVMGFIGLTIVFQKAHTILGYPSFIANILLVISISIFSVFTVTYIFKFIKFREAVIKEFNHPIRINFFPAFSICLLLISIALEHINIGASMVLWYIGAILHLLLTLFIIKRWIVQNQEIAHSNPAWFIPIVGNVIVPIMGVQYVGIEISMFYFAIGIFFWIIFFSIILNRVLFHHQLAAKFIPTLFIFIAPAAVGFIAYVKISFAMDSDFNLDIFAYFIYDIGLFFSLLLLSMFKEFAKVPFSITWWAYTFPLAAIGIATLLMYSLTKSDIMYVISNIFIVITLIIITIVSIKTIKSAIKREVCIKE